MAGSYANSSEYIKHHLTNLTYGQKADGTWGIAHGSDEIAEMGFWSINVDSMLFSIGLGVLFLWMFRKAIWVSKTNGGIQPYALRNIHISKSAPCIHTSAVSKDWSKGVIPSRSIASGSMVAWTPLQLN